MRVSKAAGAAYRQALLMAAASQAPPALPPFHDAVVVGAGPAGLATSYELGRRGIDHVVLERGDQPGFVWANLYDSLTLHTGRHMSGLPGKPIPRSMPLFPPREAFVAYLQDYARQFQLPVRTGVEVTRIDRSAELWALSTSLGEVRARAVVMATGIVSSPQVPDVTGKAEFHGRVMHSSEYRRPSDVPGARILVVGVGNSGAEIASELAHAGRAVDISVRSGANVVPLTLAGIPVQYLAYWLRKLPRPLQLVVTEAVRKIAERRRGPSPLPRGRGSALDAIPIIGFHLVDAIAAKRVAVRPGVTTLTKDGVIFGDGTASAYDSIILATGYRAALAPLADSVRRDAKGFALRVDRVRSADHPTLFAVGHNYDASGGLKNIARDSGLAAAAVAEALSKADSAPPAS